MEFKGILGEIVEKSNEAKSLRNEVEGLIGKGKMQKLDLKVLELIRKFLDIAEKENYDLDEIYEELYYFQYAFEDPYAGDYSISHDVREFFLNFQKDLTPKEIKTKIEEIENGLE